MNTLIQFIRKGFNDPLWRFQASLIGLVLLTLFGAIMYALLEGWQLDEGLYMTVITIATVGFGEVRPLTPSGRILTMILIVLGVGTATSALSNALSLALGPLLWESIQRRRVQQKVSQMENHYIVCGYGRIGRQILRDLQARGEEFVLIDVNPDVEERMIQAKLPYIIGDATRDEVLQLAGIERAKGVVAALNNDPMNVMLVLTARQLNPSAFIVARIVHVESESKLRRAGANRVINPYQIGGHRMALSLLRPAVDDFMERIFHLGEGSEIDIGQFSVFPNSPYHGQTVGECDLRSVHQVNILAIQQPNGELILTPTPSIQLQAGATLILIGPPEAIYRLERTNQTKP